MLKVNVGGIDIKNKNMLGYAKSFGYSFSVFTTGLDLLKLSFLVSLFVSFCYIFHLAIAKLSPNFSFSWAEMVFNLDLPHPPTPGKYRNGQIKLNIEKQN